METAALKSFATWARKALINEVTARVAAVLAPGSPERIELPKSVAALEAAVREGGGGDAGRAAVADRVAYTWFNRIIAMRFMDANGYNGIGVVSPQSGVEVGQPEILAEAKRGSFDDEAVSANIRKTVTALLDGTRPSADPQGEAYALLLTEYCRHWHRAMPFMFERAGDFTELLMPANLLADESVLNRAVTVMTKDVCKDVEVIGWLYQFYISERKDEVFAGFKKGKKAGAAEIPAATQLFTPHWIVQYLVQNSLGRLWLLNRPNSRLVDKMEYYIAPVDEETDFLKISGPEELTVMDPACGSGHMLTYAFDLLYSIYEEEGYAPSEIPGLILTKNLFGTEIDPRAGALAAFALTMKARAKQRTFFNKKVEPNICVLEPIRFTPQELDFLVTPDGDRDEEIEFWNAFSESGLVGSLIRPRRNLIPNLETHLDNHPATDLISSTAVNRAKEVFAYTKILSNNYHIAITNPPYMGSRNLDDRVADFARAHYPDSKTDLFAMFIERCRELVANHGLVAMITMHSWMFLASFERLRRRILSASPPITMAHLGDRAFDSIGGAVVSTTAFVLEVGRSRDRHGLYLRLVDGRSESAKSAEARAAAAGRDDLRVYSRASIFFDSIPSAPVAYWLQGAEIANYYSGRLLGAVAEPKKGMDTGDNGEFLRMWWEVSSDKVASEKSGEGKWYSYNKGGDFRRWYGNRDFVVNWANNGADIRARLEWKSRKPTLRNLSYMKREGFTWGTVSPSGFSARYSPPGALFDNGGSTLFATRQLEQLGALMNSSTMDRYLQFLAPTFNFQPGDIGNVPVPQELEEVEVFTERCVEIARLDWENRETSLGFRGSPLMGLAGSVAARVQKLFQESIAVANELRTLESRHNAAIASAYGLDDIVPIEVPIQQVTLYGNPAYRYGLDVSGEALVSRIRRDSVDDLLSYAVGCMFGRYSLDEPGLILADQGATLDGYLEKIPNPKFTPDADNVIPIVDGDWFQDDIVARFRKFLRVAFGEEHFKENLRFVTDSLDVKDLRDYFVKSFFKDHVQRYKKRPIYWLFSSPKGSFNALIYMHRYTPSTVSTVLNEYLREYKAKLKGSLGHQERLVAAGRTPRQQAAAQKEADRLRKVLLELDEYEHDVLYPLASQQIAIDLDDGVKANYPKFGAALKKIPGLEAAE